MKIGEFITELNKSIVQNIR